MMPRSKWQKLTQSTRSEIQHIRDNIMSSSTNSIPLSGGSTTHDTTTSTVSNHPIFPKQYSNLAEHAVNFSMQSTPLIETQQHQKTSDEPDSEQLISLITEVLKHKEELYHGICSIYTVHA
jgi:hypothetical protein